MISGFINQVMLLIKVGWVAWRQGMGITMFIDDFGQVKFFPM
jgi:hypothetical protein